MVPCGGHGNSVYLFLYCQGLTSVRPRGSGDPGAISAFTRVFNALCTRMSPSLGPRFRGDERRMLLPHPFSLFGYQEWLGVVSRGQTRSAPVSALGQEIALIPLSLPSPSLR